MAAEAVTGGTTVAFAEYDDDPSRILAHHWPDVPNLRDVKAIDWQAWAGQVDIITAGYPCQPFSHAGKRAGENDPRHLWPHIAAGVRVVRPRLVLLENVAGHLSLGFGRVLGDLAELGYDAWWVRLRAADIGAPHGRARVFIAATTGDTDGSRSDRRATAGLEREARPTPRPAPRATAPDSDDRGARDRRSGQDRRRVSVDELCAGAPADAAVSGRGWAEGQQRGERSAERLAADYGSTAPADAARVGRGEGRPEPARRGGRPETELGGAAAADAAGEGREGRGAQQVGGPPALAADRGPVAPDANEPGSEAYIGRPWAGDARRLQSVVSGDTHWGAYEPAVRRWEHVTARPAPRPTEPGRNGRERLSPAFVEWMMGLPEGHVTAVPGLSRNAQLKALGNGVVPQQAAAAYRALLAGIAQERAA